MNREQDKRIAEMMGCFVTKQYGASRCGCGDEYHSPHNDPNRAVLKYYTSDPTADYEVLKFIRENWDEEKIVLFCHALRDEHARNHLAGVKNLRIYATVQFMHYMPGAYSRAALKALNNDR